MIKNKVLPLKFTLKHKKKKVKNILVIFSWLNIT